MSNFAPAAESAVQIIAFLSACEQEVGVSALSSGTGINKNMAFRILNSLEKEGWVYCRDQKYSLTLLPFKLLSKPVSRLSLNTAAAPVLCALHDRTGESTYLGILKGDKVLYIQHLDGVKDVRIAGRLGGEYDLYCSAPGKVLLAFADPDFVERYLSAELQKHTANTITDPEAMRTELQSIRELGYATDREEFGNGITCVAAPIWDHTGKVIGCVGNSAFTFDHNTQEIVDQLLPYVLHAAQEISARLGGNGYGL